MKDNRSLLRAIAVWAAAWACRSKGTGLCLPVLLLLLSEWPVQTIPVKERFNAGEEVQYELYFKWGILMPRAGQATFCIEDPRYEDNPAYHYNLLFRTSGMFEKIFSMRYDRLLFHTRDAVAP